jgi:hypothetical protein
MERNRMTSSRSSSGLGMAADRSSRASAKYGPCGWDSVGFTEGVEMHPLDYLKLLKGQVAKVSVSLLSRRLTCTFEGRARLAGPPRLGFGWVSVGAICSGNGMKSVGLAACLQNEGLPR